MGAVADAPLGPLDVGGMRDELDELQERLDQLSRRGANPYAVARLQRALQAARRDLAVLAEDDRRAQASPG